MKQVIKLVLVVFLFLLTSCTTQFKQNTPKIYTDNDKIEMNVGENKQLDIKYENVDDKTLKIEMDNEGIVSVDEELNVTALNEGEVKVTVSLKVDKNKKIVYTIVVSKLIEFEFLIICNSSK